MSSTDTKNEVSCKNDGVKGDEGSSSSSSSSSLFHWPPLESNPQVFTDYLHQIGMSYKYEIGEVFGFDEELLAFLPQPILGIIVAFERTVPRDRTNRTSDDGVTVDFFMKQSGTLDNACGIIACIHSIFNNLSFCNKNDDDVIVIPDSVLHKFQETTQSQSPEERCISLEKDNDFRTYHKKFAMKGQSETIVSNKDTQKVKHHFVAFVIQGGYLFELDGTRNGPHLIGQCEDVLRGTIAEMKRRLEAKEISESLSMMTLQLNQQ